MAEFSTPQPFHKAHPVESVFYILGTGNPNGYNVTL